MRLAFMGTPAFSVPALRALYEAGHEVVVVYCQPPRPSGRGHRVQRSAVQAEAERLGLPVRHPERLRNNKEEHAFFMALGLDVAVVAAYGLILPDAMLAAPRLGCLNIHASLLPRWRGASPIQSAILAGDKKSGVTIMQMDSSLDTGPMLAQESVTLDEHMTASCLHDELAAMGSRLILHALEVPTSPTAQSEEGATYAPRLTKKDGAIDWSADCKSIDRQIRALNPWPGTFTLQNGEVLKIIRAAPLPGESHQASPGTTVNDNLKVACGEGALQIMQVQRPGKSVISTEEYLRGRPVPAGTRLGR